MSLGFVTKERKRLALNRLFLEGYQLQLSPHDKKLSLGENNSNVGSKI